MTWLSDDRAVSHASSAGGDVVVLFKVGRCTFTPGSPRKVSALKSYNMMNRSHTLLSISSYGLT